jgi:hypothetical protein
MQLEAGVNPARPRHCERFRPHAAHRTDAGVQADQVDSVHHPLAQHALGRESRPASSQETGPFVPARNPSREGRGANAGHSRIAAQS